MLELRVPVLAESVSEAQISSISKSEGDFIGKDEVLFELETDKVSLEVCATASGVIKSIHVKEGDSVSVGDLLAEIDSEASQSSASSASVNKEITSLADTRGLSKEKKITKKKPSPSAVKASFIASDNVPQSSPNYVSADVPSVSSRPERVVKMSKIRLKIAERLKHSQNTAAILTTFNEVDMTNVMSLRAQYKEKFEKRYGVKLGFMSFFVKAAVHALQEIQDVNAEIRDDCIVYKDYCDIGVAVGTENGLVVPVLRNAQNLHLHQIESEIVRLGQKARDGKLTLADMTGGTFTISNGGVYGSLLSTPIINPPQSGILGMHSIQKRPVVVNDKIEIRSMMYLALSYDHRIVDGKGAVTFLVKIKQLIEDPSRILLLV